MDLHETFSVAIDALRANKLRAALTSLGVIIGSASIVLVVTVALTSKKFVISQIESVGANLVWVEVVKSPDKAQPLSHELTLQDMEVARSIPGVAQVAGTSDLQMSVVAEGIVRPVTLIGVTAGYQDIRRLIVLRGRYLDSTDMESRGKVCLITPQLAEKLFGRENPIGHEVRMGELTFTVIGVFKERVETFGLSDIQSESVLVPFGLMKSYTGVDVLRVLDVQAENSDGVARVQKQVGILLRSRHPPEAEYNVQTLTAILVAAQNISLALTIVLIVIAFIALLISGIGIMNIMLVTVKERTREIGIRKAIGAPRRDILYQFLIEAFLISGGGAVLGILIGLAVPVAAQLFLPGNLRVPISPMSVVVAFLVSCTTGLFFGYLPANNAARLQPIESLRYE
ncbi:MAG TPA: ABC transporter permease [Candidatus Dormibacteraeota bacterium]|jgi:putative ABC transport system permease protein|nr:ABC transporter permease [Candidatus Dormibacteraeota bacterium]